MQYGKVQVKKIKTYLQFSPPRNNSNKAFLIELEDYAIGKILFIYCFSYTCVWQKSLNRLKFSSAYISETLSEDLMIRVVEILVERVVIL